MIVPRRTASVDQVSVGSRTLRALSIQPVVGHLGHFQRRISGSGVTEYKNEGRIMMD